MFWFSSKNPVGDGMAAWVDIISVWAFGMANHIDSTQLVDLKGSVDIAYMHSMSTCYPTLFVWTAKDQILSTTTIKMFESHNAWRGDCLRDGFKQCLMDTLAIAVCCHCQYCKDNHPERELQAMALQTANAVNTFWERLVVYIDNKYSSCTVQVALQTYPSTSIQPSGTNLQQHF